MCRGGRVDMLDVYPSYQERRNTSEEVCGCSEKGHEESYCNRGGCWDRVVEEDDLLSYIRRRREKIISNKILKALMGDFKVTANSKHSTENTAAL